MSFRLFSVNLLALVLAIPTAGQTRLQPTATFPEPFSQVVGIRELSDGRVIIADRLEKHVSYLDFSRGTLQQIGGEGEGPGEYQQPTGLTPFPDDGTLLSDFGNLRVSLIDRNGAINESWPMMSQSKDGGTRIIRPSASDREGRIYFSNVGISLRGRSQNAPPPDSSYLMRFDLENETADTVAALYSEPIAANGEQSVRISGGTARLSGFKMRPFRAQDGWAVMDDGRLAIVRATDYRIDWYDPDGRTVRGTPNQYEPVRVGQAEKEAWANRSSGANTVMIAAGNASSGSSSFSIPTPDVDDVDFPEFMPPFGTNAVSVSARGHIWVQLNRSARDPEPLFDVFDSTGKKIDQIQLPEGRRLVGFGSDSVFAVSVDDDDLQWLERYEYPAGR